MPPDQLQCRLGIVELHLRAVAGHLDAFDQMRLPGRYQGLYVYVGGTRLTIGPLRPHERGMLAASLLRETGDDFTSRK